MDQTEEEGWLHEQCILSMRTHNTLVALHMYMYITYTLVALVQVGGLIHPSWWVEPAWLGTFPTESSDGVLCVCEARPTSLFEHQLESFAVTHL